MFQVTIAGYAGNDIDQKQVPLKNKSGSVEIGTVSIGINTGKDQTTWVKAKFLGTQTNNRAHHNAETETSVPA